MNDTKRTIWKAVYERVDDAVFYTVDISPYNAVQTGTFSPLLHSPVIKSHDLHNSTNKDNWR